MLRCGQLPYAVEVQFFLRTHPNQAARKVVKDGALAWLLILCGFWQQAVQGTYCSGSTTR
jgi:hypothetical protein